VTAALSRRLLWIALRTLFPAALCLAGGCGAVSDGGAGAPPPPSAPSIKVGTELAAQQVLTRTLSAEVDSLDPALVAGTTTQYVLDDLFEGLTVLSADAKVQPGAASSWEISADGKLWTFHLRPSARWSNGEPVTAQDFVYGWRHTVDPKTGASYAQAVAPVEHALEIAEGKRPLTDLGVEAVDAHTLRVQLSEPAPYFAAMLANGWMFPEYEPVVSRYGDAWTQPEHIVSNGPFRLRERVIGSRLTLDRNPYYWDAEHVKLSRVTYLVIDDRNAQAQRFLAGQVDFVDTFPTTERPWLMQQLGDQVVEAPYFGTLMLGLNMQKPPFKDNRALRLALSLAIDRDMIVEHILNGVGYSAFSIMPPLEGYEQQVPDWARLSTAQRHQRARELYRQAGYSAQHPLRAELACGSGDQLTVLLYEAVAAMWRELLGAQVTLHTEEFKILLQNNHLHQHLLFHNAWIGDYPDPFTFMQQDTTGFDLNYTGYSNPQFDQLIARAQRESDNVQRYRLFEQAERMLNDEAVNIPVYFYSVRHLIKPYLKGWVANSTDRNLSRYMYLLQHDGS
jgi:oligopeptide transport system substrate-binding protein